MEPLRTILINQVSQSYVWKIDNFSTLVKEKKISEYIDTEKLKSRKHFSFYLRMYPTGDWREGFVSLHIFCPVNYHMSKQCTFEVSILNSKNQKVNSWSTTNINGNNQNSSFIKLETLLNEHSDLLIDDKLTLVCDINLLINNIKINPKFEAEIRASDDFQRMFENNKFSDFTLIVSDKEFYVHKCILASRCPGLFTMIEDIDENINSLSLNNIDSNVVQELLRFIYTNKVQNLETLVDKLLLAANQFGLQDLKEICEKWLFDNISINNAFETLIFADKSNSQRLKDFTLSFIAEHMNNTYNIEKTAGFESLMGDHIELMKELFQVVSQYIENYNSYHETFRDGSQYYGGPDNSDDSDF